MGSSCWSCNLFKDFLSSFLGLFPFNIILSSCGSTLSFSFVTCINNFSSPGASTFNSSDFPPSTLISILFSTLLISTFGGSIPILFSSNLGGSISNLFSSNLVGSIPILSTSIFGGSISILFSCSLLRFSSGLFASFSIFIFISSSFVSFVCSSFGGSDSFGISSSLFSLVSDLSSAQSSPSSHISSSSFFSNSSFFCFIFLFTFFLYAFTLHKNLSIFTLGSAGFWVFSTEIFSFTLNLLK